MKNENIIFTALLTIEMCIMATHSSAQAKEEALSSITIADITSSQKAETSIKTICKQYLKIKDENPEEENIAITKACEVMGCSVYIHCP